MSLNKKLTNFVINDELLRTALDSSASELQANALGDLGNTFRDTMNAQALKTLAQVVLDEEADAENRWLAYLFMLETACVPANEMPLGAPGIGFQVPDDFDIDFVTKWS